MRVLFFGWGVCFGCFTALPPSPSLYPCRCVACSQVLDVAWSLICSFDLFVFHKWKSWSKRTIARCQKSCFQFFDEAFAKALEDTPLWSLAFVSAINVRSSVEFAELALRWASSWKDRVLPVFSERVQMLEHFWSICKVSESLLGFCSSVRF